MPKNISAPANVSAPTSASAATNAPVPDILTDPTTRKSPRFAEIPPGQTHWWQGLVGYQIYVLSFADSNGDGIGDIAGIIQKLEHIKWLGADIVWVNPFFSSPGKDHGYDVSDYLAINPQHGTMADFERLVEATHSLGMAFVLDVVPNHTSSEHAWFQESKSSRDNPKRDWYLWRDPAPDGGPPNNWVSHFGGPAWTLDPDTQQYYCHLFLPEQPDLNWRNPQVQQAFDEILRFWCDKGVDGFRVDVGHAMIKHPDFPDNPLIAEPTAEMGARDVFNCFEHKYELDQDGAADVFRDWRRAVAPYDAMILGEINIPQGHRFARFVGDDAMDLAFHLPPMWSPWQPEQLIREIVDLCEHAPDRVSWVLSNHDGGRPVSRFVPAPDGASPGDGAASAADPASPGAPSEVGLRRTFAVTTAMFALGGVPFLFQGEELGLPNAIISTDNLTDPLATRNEHGASDSRDVCRAHMPWEPGPTNGFTTAEQPWLKSEPRPEELTVAGQRQSGGGDQPKAPLSAYRNLLQLRKDHPEIWRADLKVEALAPEVLLVERDKLRLLANLSPQPYEMDFGARDAEAAGIRQLFTSESVLGEGGAANGNSAANGGAAIDGTAVTVPAETSVLFELG